jgi:endonuclease/exonuclease/phosphatase family metal-dependent hydrolase
MFVSVFLFSSCSFSTTNTVEKDISTDSDFIIIEQENNNDLDNNISIEQDNSILDQDIILSDKNQQPDNNINDNNEQDLDIQIIDKDSEVEDEDIVSSSSLHIKITAANITSGNQQSYQGPGIRIFQALKPDIALVQEFNYNNGTIRQLIDTAFGKNYYICEGDGQIPNGIVSKWPIIKCDFWDDPNISNRDLDYAIIDIPGNKDILAVSVHLHTKPHSDQVTAGRVIADKIYEIKQKNPGKYYYVVGGDFNGSSAVSSSSFGAHKSFAINDAYPVSKSGKSGTNASRSKHYDWVLVSPDLSPYQVSTNYGSFKYPHGLVFDSREYSQKELDNNFSPVKTSDSGATNMQHMSVTKDFEIKY